MNKKEKLSCLHRHMEETSILKPQKLKTAKLVEEKEGAKRTKDTGGNI